MAGKPRGSAPLDAAGLHRLMAWLSPSYPVGAFSYSSGIEWAVEAGDIKDVATLTRWIATVFGHGAGFCDAVFFVHAHRATQQGDAAALRELCHLAAAFVPSKERHLETMAQGRAFLDTTSKAWPCAALDLLGGEPAAYPVVVAVACAGHGMPLAPSLQGILHAVAANMISAGVRLVPLGQTDGQRALAAMEPLIVAVSDRAIASTLDDLGSATFRADIASMRHETQYTRLFRS